MNITSDVRKLLDSESKIFCSPQIKFLGQDAKMRIWKVSVLVVSSRAHPDKFVCKEAFEIKYEVFKLQQYVIEKFFLNLQQTKKEREVEYSLLNRSFSVLIPGYRNVLKAAFFSCNGFHSYEDEKSLGGIDKMWEAYVSMNSASRPHLLLFGGDQEYFDPVFELPCLQDWLKLSYKERIKSPFTEQMDAEIGNFYLEKYIEKFALDTPLGKALSGACSIMNWDDHDIFDGFGSFTKDLQSCPVFQGIFRHAKTYYLIFQQHVNPAKPYANHDFIGSKSFSILRTMDDLAILAIDTRSKRTRDTILPKDAWDEIFDACDNLSSNCKHLFVALPVPIAYPDFSDMAQLAEKMDASAEMIKNVLDALKSTKLKRFLISPLSTVDLVDDFIDEWRDPHHIEERKMLIGQLQKVAKEKQIRITFLTGDVHLGGVGEFYNPHEPDKEYDPHYMPQIISSPMGNIPAGDKLASFLSYGWNKTEVLDKHTFARLVPIKKEKENAEKILFSNRNWAQLDCDPKTLQIAVALHVEAYSSQFLKQTVIERYTMTIPPYFAKQPLDENSDTDSSPCECVLL